MKNPLIPIAAMMLSVSLIAPLAHARDRQVWLNACSGWTDDESVPAAYARGTSWSANKSNTWGWQLMTTAERLEYQNKIRSFSSYEECKAYDDRQRVQIAERAHKQAIKLPELRVGASGCDSLKARGILK